MPPKEVVEQLEPISSDWLERKVGKHAAEMGFSLGRFDGLAEADDLVETPLVGDDLPHDAVPRLVVGVATEQTGRPCAFFTFTPIYGSARSWGWAVDLMRRVPDAPRGVMELLLVRAVERFRERGANVVSLGLAAMADTRQEMPPLQRQFASLVYEHMRLLKTHR